MYNYDQESAASAGKQGEKINELGEYVGHFTMVEHLVNKDTGSVGMGFHFESNQGQTAYFYMNMVKKDGSDNEIGRGHRNAMMKILQARSLKPVDGLKEKTDFDTKEVKKIKTQIFKELENKPIGILFGSHEEVYNGNVITKLDHVLFFDAETRFSAGELINKAIEPKDVDAVKSRLKHRTLQINSGKNVDAGNHAVQNAVNDDMEDDIPF